ncbi:GNAT family N-acetyltransferase [Nocardioides litoris]|uniref:GNAT family N-acetyltransferase n=1 Tax=Nocardioides litoris TaxID=1926648 RepID=UPI001FE5F8C2|nr:GNAT family N-acetyltransferase [Nocardioides litoris]
MTRSMVTLREAEAGDVLFLAELWESSLRRADHQDQVADLEQVVKSAGGSTEQRIVVAEYDGRPAGAVLLRITTVTPLNLDPVVQVLSPVVLPEFRRHGVGRLLMDAALAYAEDNGVTQVSTAAAAGSRDSNRFLARLAFAPLLTYRVAPTVSVRARLAAQRPVVAPTAAGGRQLGRVLAARRSQRRALGAQPPTAP